MNSGLKCPHCGDVGAEIPHRIFERWGPNQADKPDDSAAIRAAGFDPKLTSTSWFECAKCRKSSPYYSLNPKDKFDLSGFNTIKPDGKVFDPFHPPR